MIKLNSIWEEVINLRFSVITGRKSLQLPQYWMEIQSGLKMLQWLYDEECNDEFTTNEEPILNLTNRILRFKIRLRCFLIIICDLEMLIEKDYTVLYQLINNNKVAKKIRENLESYKIQIKDLKFYRDKIFAHNSLTSPREEDNFTDKLTSLLYAYSVTVNFEKGYYSLGGLTEGSNPNHTYPTVSIIGEYEHLIQHYELWAGNFVELLNKERVLEIKGQSRKSFIINDLCFPTSSPTKD